MAEQRMPLANRTNWGSFDYNAPFDVATSSSRTSYRVAHRHIPPANQCRKKFAPLPFSYFHRDRSLIYRTSSNVHGNFETIVRPATAYFQRQPCSTNVHYMAFSDERMTNTSHGHSRKIVSETKENYRASPQTEPPVDPHSSCGHFPLESVDKYKDLPDQDLVKGYNVHMDPYVTTSRFHHSGKQNVAKFRCSSAKGDIVTSWSDTTYPKIVGVHDTAKEMYMPLNAKMKHTYWGNERYDIDKLDKFVPRPIRWRPGTWISETKKQYTIPHQAFLTC